MRHTKIESEPHMTKQTAATAIGDEQRFHLEWQRAEALGDAFFRIGRPLGRHSARRHGLNH